jgi:hypothetical protein
MQDTTAIARMEVIYQSLSPLLDERLRRQWAAAEAQGYGWGGLRAVHTATGLSVNTIRKGRAELAAREAGVMPPVRIRQEGGGRKCQTERDPGLAVAFALALQEYRRVGASVDHARTSGQCPYGGASVACDGLQFAKQSQDARRN